MKAMILAAGLGTRLRPLTVDRPKALVEVADRTLLEIALRRLREFGIREVIVNVHHFADQVVAYLKAKDNFGMRIEISREDILLDTGGGLKKAAWFFAEGSTSAAEPLILHNVDVISTIDLAQLVRTHGEKDALATLAVQDRSTSRYLLFDENERLCGRQSGKGGTAELVNSPRETSARAFCGIHVISPHLLSRLTEEGAFSIITAYLRLAGAGDKICAFRAGEYYWRDLGKPENVTQAAMDVEHGMIRL
jgi:NDP-sugar pyrophosphorylase family protein